MPQGRVQQCLSEGKIRVMPWGETEFGAILEPGKHYNWEGSAVLCKINKLS